MHALLSRRVSPGERATEGAGRSVRGASPGTATLSRTTCRTSDALVLPGALRAQELDEISSCGQPRSNRDPDLHVDLDSPPCLARPYKTSSAPVYQDGLTRLDPLPDPYEFGLDLTVQHNEPEQDYLLQPRISFFDDRRLDEADTDTSRTSSDVSFYSDSDLEPQYLPSSSETFFDPSPSPSSVSASPEYPRLLSGLEPHPHLSVLASRYRAAQSPSRMPSSPPEPITSSAGPALTSWTASDADFTSAECRPKSAPKSGQSRSASPLVFWSRKGPQPSQVQRQKRQQHQAENRDCRTRDLRTEWLAAEEGVNQYGIDSVSNHLDKMASPAAPMLGVKSGSLGVSNDLRAAGDNQLAKTPLITREEYEALPLAIQRKVRLLALHDSVLASFSACVSAEGYTSTIATKSSGGLPRSGSAQRFYVRPRPARFSLLCPLFARHLCSL